jgi:uroporphyrin-III C-methyltransferase
VIHLFLDGSEEIDYVESFGIPTFVVPGIPRRLLFQLQGISLTKEACQRVLGNNGTTSARKLSTDVACSAIICNSCGFNGNE